MIFEGKGSSDTGLKFPTQSLLPPLYSGITLANFQESGKMPFLKLQLIRKVIFAIKILKASLMIRLEISLMEDDLFMSISLQNLRTSSSVVVILSILLSGISPS